MTSKEINAQIVQLEKEKETILGTKCEVYSRIVGYHRPVDNWNESKQEEFKDRTVFDVDTTCCRV
ncbi:MAG: anaerobic ribonucleoside-triphosphate reductase [Deferribacterales bacterium]